MKGLRDAGRAYLRARPRGTRLEEARAAQLGGAPKKPYVLNDKPHALKRLGSSVPHGGLRPFHNKSTFPHAVDLRAFGGANLVT